MNETEIQEAPDWLTKDFIAHSSAWEPEAKAWLVMPLKHPETGQPLPQQHQEDERDAWPVGLVTPDGRWLLQPSEGACQAFVSGAYINVYFPESPTHTGRASGLMDFNGHWVVPPSAGYRELMAITPHVVQCLSAQVPEHHDLRSLPTMDLLQATIIGHASWQPEDNTLRAYRGGEIVEQELVLDIHGQLLFESHYERINAFDPKTGLAVAAVRQPCTESDGSASSRALEGVIHISGTMIIPCEYELIERSFLSSPPRVHPGGKLLAFTTELQPRVFSTAGKLLAAPNLYASRSKLKLKKGELLTLMGNGPEAEIAMFSMKDFSATPTGQTWREYLGSQR